MVQTKSVGVIGAGQMGAGIADMVARGGIPAPWGDVTPRLPLADQAGGESFGVCRAAAFAAHKAEVTAGYVGAKGRG